MIASASVLGMPTISVTNPMIIYESASRMRKEEPMESRMETVLRQSHTRVEENRFPPSDRVSTNQWVLSDDRFPSYGAAKGTGPICLNLCRVQSLKSFEVFLHAR